MFTMSTDCSSPLLAPGPNVGQGNSTRNAASQIAGLAQGGTPREGPPGPPLPSTSVEAVAYPGFGPPFHPGHTAASQPPSHPNPGPAVSSVNIQPHNLPAKPGGAPSTPWCTPGVPGAVVGPQGGHSPSRKAGGVPSGAGGRSRGGSPVGGGGAVRPGPGCAGLPLGRLRMKRVRSSEDDEVALDNYMNSKRYLSALMASSMTNLRLADIRVEEAASNRASPSCGPGTPNGSSGSVDLRSSSPLRDAFSLGHRSPSPFANDDSPRSAMSDDSADSGLWDASAARPVGLLRSRGSVLQHSSIHGMGGAGAGTLAGAEAIAAAGADAGAATGARPDQRMFPGGAQSLGTAHAHDALAVDPRLGMSEPSASGQEVLSLADRGLSRPSPSCPALDQGTDVRIVRRPFSDRLSSLETLSTVGFSDQGLALQHSSSHSHLWDPPQLPSPRPARSTSLWRSASTGDPEPPSLPQLHIPRSSFAAAGGGDGGEQLPTSPSDRTGSANLRKAALIRAQQRRANEHGPMALE